MLSKSNTTVSDNKGFAVFKLSDSLDFLHRCDFASTLTAFDIH